VLCSAIRTADGSLNEGVLLRRDGGEVGMQSKGFGEDVVGGGQECGFKYFQAVRACIMQRHFYLYCHFALVVRRSYSLSYIVGIYHTLLRSVIQFQRNASSGLGIYIYLTSHLQSPPLHLAVNFVSRILSMLNFLIAKLVNIALAAIAVIR
jgi:hypothetical protein